MADFTKLAEECEAQIWREDDRYPSVSDTFSHGPGHPPRVAPTTRSQLEQILKTMAAFCREATNG